MLNIIKMDTYRMTKSPVTWLILLAAMLMMIASIFMTSVDISYYEQNPEALEKLEASDVDVDWGIHIGSITPEWCTGIEIPLSELISVNIRSKLPLMLLVVFLVSFVNGDNRTGFVKNIAGHVDKRGKLIFAKIVPLAVYTVVLLLLVAFTITLSCKFFFGYINWDNWSSLIPFLGAQLLLHIGFAMVMVCLLTLIKSSVASLIIGILIASGLLQLVDTILIAVIPKLGAISGFSVMTYMTSGNVGKLMVDSTPDIYIRSLIVAILYIVVMTAISMFIVQKRDIE